MKRLFLVMLILLNLHGVAIADNSGASWDSEGVTLHGFGHFSQAHANLIYTADEPVFYNLTTTFTTFTSLQTTHMSTNMFSNASSVILGPGAGGDIVTLVSFGIESEVGAEVTIGLFKNSTTMIASRAARFSGGHNHSVAFLNLSGDGVSIASGSLSDLQVADGTSLVINEGTSTPGFVIEFVFNGYVNNPTSVRFENVLYDGLSGHEIEARAEKCDGTLTEMRIAVKDFPASSNTDPESAYLREFLVPTPTQDYVCSNSFTMRLVHTSAGNAGHDVYFGSVSLLDDHSSRSITFFENHNLNEGESLSLRLKAETDNTSVWIGDVKFSMFKIGIH